MITQVLYLLSVIVGSLQAKRLEEREYLPLQVRIEIVKNAIESRYDEMVLEVIDYHHYITQQIRLGQIDAQAYMSGGNHDLRDIAEGYLEELRAFANEQILQKVPDADIDSLQSIYEYVHQLYDQLYQYIFAFVPPADMED